MAIPGPSPASGKLSLLLIDDDALFRVEESRDTNSGGIGQVTARCSRRHRRQGEISVFLMEDFIVDVGPELLKETRSSVDRDIREPKLIGLGKGALLARIVKTGDARGCARADDLGSVESLMAAIRPCNGDA